MDKLIFVDGMSGTGKGTQIENIRRYFGEKSINVSRFSQPSEFMDGKIREYWKLPLEERNPRTELYMFLADRHHLYHGPVARVADDVVIMDRSRISSYAYQSDKGFRGEEGVPFQLVKEMHSSLPSPDLSLLFLCEPEMAYERIQSRGEATRTEALDYLGRIKLAYENVLPSLFDASIVRCDSTRRATWLQVRSHLNNLFGVDMEKAVFLDKDGTLVDNSGYPEVIPTDKIFPGTIGPLRRLQGEDYKLFIVSNQPWAGNGRMTHGEVVDSFESVVSLYDSEGITIDGYYMCEHQRDDGCGCKKPGTGMLEDAIEEHNVDTSKSWMMGDMGQDVLAGRNIGLRTIRVPCNVLEDRFGAEPTYHVTSFEDGVSCILSPMRS